MLANQLITNEVPPIKVSEPGTKALRWMEEFKVSELPVVDSTKFLGLVSYSQLIDLNKIDSPLEKLKLVPSQIYISEDQHIFEVIALISTHNISIIPVLNEDKNYLGCITLRHLMQQISAITSIHNPGGIIVLEINASDYTLSEIARIVEENDSKILCTYITSLPDSNKIELTVKINTKDLRSILKTLERYKYTVKASFQERQFQESLKDRYDALMNYLNW